MNRYELAKVGVLAKEGIARFGGSTENYEKFLKKFPADPHFIKLCQGIAAQDCEAAFAAAHALRGIAGNLSMTQLYHDLFPLVEALRHENLKEAEELLQTVREDYDRLIAVIG